MAIRVGTPRFRGSGGALKVGSHTYSYPPGSRVEYSEDRRLAFVLVPKRGYSHPWELHVVHEAGEVFGVEARLLLRIERELFGVT